MEKDSHYYVIYYLCLAAGFDPDSAYAVSYSSQYVDDSKDGHKKTLFDQNSRNIGEFEPVRTSHNGFESIGTDVQEKIYYPFHFLPGLKGDSFDQKMVTQKGAEGELYSILIQEALKSNNSYRIGITLHAFADTYSHTNFSGLWAWDNTIRQVNYIPAKKGWFSNLFNKCQWLLTRKWFEAAPAVGHAQAYKFPDFPYLNWKYLDYQGSWHTVSNSFKYRQGFMELYDFLIRRYAQSQKLAQRADSDKVLQQIWEGIRVPGNLKKRCAYWRGVLKKFASEFKLVLPEEHLNYKETDWEKSVLKRLKKLGIFASSDMKLKVQKSHFEKSHYFQFHKAALEHRLFVLSKINEYITRGQKKKIMGTKMTQKETAIPQGYIDTLQNRKILT